MYNVHTRIYFIQKKLHNNYKSLSKLRNEAIPQGKKLWTEVRSYVEMPFPLEMKGFQPVIFLINPLKNHGILKKK